MPLHLVSMLRLVAPRQKTAMDLRVQSLHAPIHHFRKARYLFNLRDMKPRLLKRQSGSACRDDANPIGFQRARQLHNARLVVNRKKRV